MFSHKIENVCKYMLSSRITLKRSQLKCLQQQQQQHRNLALSSSQNQQAQAQSQSTQPGPSYFHQIGRTPLAFRNIGQELERAVSEYSSIEAIVSCHEGRRYTFTSLIDEVDRLAAGFRKLGLETGDYIGIWAPNNLHWYLSMLAANRAGLVAVGINPAFQAMELEYCLKKVNCRVLVAPESYKSMNYYEIIQSICPEVTGSRNGEVKSKQLPQLRYVIIDNPGETPKGALGFNQVLDMCDREEVRAISKLQSSIKPDSACNVQFTSGTTGQPKATVLHHFGFVNNGLHVGARNQLEGQRICVQVPLFHAYGTVITIMAGMSHGATLVLPAAGFQPEASLRAIVEERCSVIHGTPTMYVDLIKKQRELKLPLKTAKMAITGGAPCSPQLFLDIKETFGLDHVRTVFGMTETTAVIFQSCDDDSMENVLNTVGHLQDHVEAKVIDDQGNTVPFGQPGELCVRGYVNMLSYYGDEAKTKEILSEDRWLKTGDQFVLQADGFGRIVGRLKEMIIRGGENIFPKEIEDFLNSHPQVIECHVIGVPDERMGEEVCAFVRMKEGAAPLTHESVKAYSKGKMAHFKVPRYVYAVDSFPKTTSGKIQKFKLNELFKKHYSK